MKKGDGTKGCKNTYTTWKYRLSEGKLGDVVQNLDSGYIVKRASLVAQLVKNLPTMRGQPPSPGKWNSSFIPREVPRG